METATPMRTKWQNVPLPWLDLHGELVSEVEEWMAGLLAS
jgi:hypothetical protein